VMRVGEPTRILAVDMVESGIELGDQGCRGGSGRLGEV
jgi:hypothetical protein